MMQHEIKWVETPKKEKLLRREQLEKSVASEDYVKYLDKMPLEPRKELSTQVFCYHCWRCGAATVKELYSHYKLRVFCSECKDEHEQEKQKTQGII